MLADDDGGGKFPGEAGEDRGQGLGASRRRTDGDELRLRLFFRLPDSRGRFCRPGSASQKPGHGVDFFDEDVRPFQKPVGMKHRRGNDIQRPAPHGLKHFSRLLFPGVGQDQDRAGGFFHHVADQPRALDVGKRKINEQDIRQVMTALPDDIAPAACGPDDRAAGIRGNDLPQDLQGVLVVMRNGDFERHSGPPIRSRTASSRLSSWKLPLVR